VDDIEERKRALRARMREARAAIDAGERAALASRVQERLAGLEDLEGSGAVLLFYSFGTELPTSGLIRLLLERGRPVLLPYLDPGGAMEAAELLPGDEPVRSGYGPKEPPRRVAVHPEEVAVAIAPGLAFDRTGRRLGYGGGHYDRYLARLGPGAARVGIGFAVQVVDEVPAGPHDVLLDTVVTEAETIRTGARTDR
jgi:5-formyltetrahydrofolate cyclo-ligase